jgi:hypothetical protein
MKVAVAVETGAKKSFATAVDWPGWSRSGKTEELAIQALIDYGLRYAEIARAAGEDFDPDRVDVAVVGHTTGGGGTDFGVPSNVTDADRRPTTKAGADRLARLVEAAWMAFEAVAADAPEALRKGPRGGGRDTSKIVGHVTDADFAYSNEMGIKLKAPIADVRQAMLDVLREPSDGSPLKKRWTARYAAHRIAWHALDHAWEIQDRIEPAH